MIRYRVVVPLNRTFKECNVFLFGNGYHESMRVPLQTLRQLKDWCNCLTVISLLFTWGEQTIPYFKYGFKSLLLR